MARLKIGANARVNVNGLYLVKEDRKKPSRGLEPTLEMIGRRSIDYGR